MSLLAYIKTEKPTAISAGEIFLPTQKLDGFSFKNLFLKRDDFNHLIESMRISITGFVDEVHVDGFKPGMSMEQISKLLPKAGTLVDNSDNISGHEILFSRRKCDKTALSSQFHLLENKLFMIQDEFSAQCDYDDISLKKSLNGYYKNTIGAPGVSISSRTLTDRKGNFLRVRTRNHLMAQYYFKGFWEQQETT